MAHQERLLGQPMVFVTQALLHTEQSPISEALVTVYTVESAKPVHRSFRLTRGGSALAVQSQVRPALVLPEREARNLLSAAARGDVSRGGVYSAGPAGIQIWSGPWDGAGGSHGSAEHLGSVDWSYDTPARHYITVYRVLVTASGAGNGFTTEGVLEQVLSLGGLRADGTTLAMSVPPPRDPFRSIDMRERSGVEQQRI